MCYLDWCPKSIHGRLKEFFNLLTSERCYDIGGPDIGGPDIGGPDIGGFLATLEAPTLEVYKITYNLAEYKERSFATVTFVRLIDLYTIDLPNLSFSGKW